MMATGISFRRITGSFSLYNLMRFRYSSWRIKHSVLTSTFFWPLQVLPNIDLSHGATFHRPPTWQLYTYVHKQICQLILMVRVRISVLMFIGLNKFLVYCVGWLQRRKIWISKKKKIYWWPFDTKVVDMDFILSPLKGDGKAHVTKICKVHLNRTRVFHCDYVRHVFTWLLYTQLSKI